MRSWATDETLLDDLELVGVDRASAVARVCRRSSLGAVWVSSALLDLPPPPRRVPRLRRAHGGVSADARAHRGADRADRLPAARRSARTSSTPTSTPGIAIISIGPSTRSRSPRSTSRRSVSPPSRAPAWPHARWRSCSTISPYTSPLHSAAHAADRTCRGGVLSPAVGWLLAPRRSSDAAENCPGRTRRGATARGCRAAGAAFVLAVVCAGCAWRSAFRLCGGEHGSRRRVRALRRGVARELAASWATSAAPVGMVLFSRSLPETSGCGWQAACRPQSAPGEPWS